MSAKFERIAAPGYSEHHTGRALDLNCDPPEEDFENSQAFEWLCNNTEKFGFDLSYPKDNAFMELFMNLGIGVIKRIKF